MPVLVMHELINHPPVTASAAARENTFDAAQQSSEPFHFSAQLLVLLSSTPVFWYLIL